MSAFTANSESTVITKPAFITVFISYAATYVSQTAASCFLSCLQFEFDGKKYRCSSRRRNVTQLHRCRGGMRLAGLKRSRDGGERGGGRRGLVAFIALVSNGEDRFSGGARSQLSHHQ